MYATAEGTARDVGRRPEFPTAVHAGGCEIATEIRPGLRGRDKTTLRRSAEMAVREGGIAPMESTLDRIALSLPETGRAECRRSL